MSVRSCTSKFDHSRQRWITLPFTIRVLSSKYLNEDGDDDEGDQERERRREVNTSIRAYRRDAICLFQTASERRQGETDRERARDV